jgi:hypothetical protein
MHAVAAVWLCPAATIYLQVVARTVLYKVLPANQLPEAPDAKFFPGKPPASTKPLGTVSVKVRILLAAATCTVCGSISGRWMIWLLHCQLA